MNLRFRRNATARAPLLAGLVRWMVLAGWLGLAGAGRGADISPDYLTDVWTADDGLPDSSVTAIAQTPDGYLWVGTYNGLARFGGMRFVTFDPANTPALAHARIRQLYVDNLGTLWINTFDGSMTSFRNGVFALEWKGDGDLDPDASLLSSSSDQVTFLLNRGVIRHKSRSAPAGRGWEDFVLTNQVAGGQALADGQGTLWFRDIYNHLGRLAGTNFVASGPGTIVGAGRANYIATDAGGRLWVGTDRGLAVWDGARFLDASPTNSESPANMAFLTFAGDGGMWAVVNGQVRKAVGRRWVLEVPALRNTFTGRLDRLGGQEDHHGGVWLYDYGRGLTHVAADGQVRRFGGEDGFPGERVACFFADREGNYWAGLDAGGLVRIREKRFQTIDTNGNSSLKPTRSVCEDGQGTLWIGTLGNGLVRWQAGVSTNLTMPGGLGRGYAFCVCPDAAGRLWLSAGDEDLYVYETNRLRRISPLVHGVKAILADAAGRIWAGTRNGLFRADPPAGGEFHFLKAFPALYVRTLCEGVRGTVWAGTDTGRLYCISNQTAIPFVPADKPEPHAIWSLLAEPDGTVWAGTFRGGLLRFQAGRFTRYEKKDGLPDEVISQILEDGRGNLWLGSHQGVFSASLTGLNEFAAGTTPAVNCLLYGRSDGLPSLECSGGYQPAAWRGQDGRLWFATVKGVVSVRPEAIRLNRLPPPVVIEEILVDGGSLEAAAQTPDRPVPPGIVYDRENKVLTVPPGNHQIEFRYTGLSLVSSDRVQFRYQLAGADAAWVEAGTRRFVQYNLLPHGTYQFHVIACNSDRVWNETGCSLSLIVQPHFYETVWFRILGALVGAGLVAGVVWYSANRRLHRKLEQHARQQAVELERARIAKDIHDDLGASLTLIARLGQLARQEKSAERVEKMETTARQAVRSLDEIVWAVNPRNDTLAHLIDYTGQYAADYLHAAGVHCLLDLPEEAPPREVPANVRHNLFLVVKEALQNIVKHARATRVSLRIQADPRGVRINIEDNGCGFAQAPGPDDALADGLRNMRQRMQEIGGSCLIQSQSGTGTQITFQAPWPGG